MNQLQIKEWIKRLEQDEKELDSIERGLEVEQVRLFENIDRLKRLRSTIRGLKDRLKTLE